MSALKAKSSLAAKMKIEFLTLIEGQHALQEKNQVIEAQRQWINWLEQTLIGKIQEGENFRFQAFWLQAMKKTAKSKAKKLNIPAPDEWGNTFTAWKAIAAMTFKKEDTFIIEEIQRSCKISMNACDKAITKNNKMLISKSDYVELDQFSVPSTLLEYDINISKNVALLIKHIPPKKADELVKNFGTLQEKIAYATLRLKSDADYPVENLMTEPGKKAPLAEKIAYAAFAMKLAAEKALAKYDEKIAIINAEIGSGMNAQDRDKAIAEINQLMLKIQETRFANLVPLKDEYRANILAKRKEIGASKNATEEYLAKDLDELILADDFHRQAQALKAKVGSKLFSAEKYLQKLTEVTRYEKEKGKLIQTVLRLDVFLGDPIEANANSIKNLSNIVKQAKNDTRSLKDNWFCKGFWNVINKIASWINRAGFREEAGLAAKKMEIVANKMLPGFKQHKARNSKVKDEGAELPKRPKKTQH